MIKARRTGDGRNKQLQTCGYYVRTISAYKTRMLWKVIATRDPDKSYTKITPCSIFL